MTAPNRLAAESSLYLQMHARNPVDWYPWGDEALGKARTADRPIFLSSGYASCHWCHVMEREVFEDAQVAAMLNRHFVCIKVDREERPDVDATYMQAALVLTGGGGWPLSVFLTPDLAPFHAATYVPRDPFLALLTRIVDVYRDRRADLRRQAAQLSAQVLAVPHAAAPGSDNLDDDLLAAAVTAAHDGYDGDHGGFASRQKFPVPVRWRFLLHRWRQSADPTALAMVDQTLRAMAEGGLRDHLAGGFHRYTVDPQWTVPHFEKMLYDNAQLASLYLEAGAALDRPGYAEVGAETLDFLLREMRAPEGPFYASFDADSDGEEGRYYVWTPAQIDAALGETDGSVVADLLGVSPAGNFENGASVLTQRADPAAVAARHGRTPADVDHLRRRARLALRELRADRVAPTLDRKVITSWNGLAISAFAAGRATTGRRAYLDAACAAAAYLRATHRRDDGTLIRASSAGRTAGEGILDDYAFLAAGLLDLFQVSGDWAHLTWARELVEFIRRDFARDEGAFFQTRAGAPTPLGRRVELFDSVLPSGCAAAICVMLRLGSLTGDDALTAQAQRLLRDQVGLLRRAGTEMAAWLDAALLVVAPLYAVVVAGDAADARTEDLAAAVLSSWPPQVVLARVPAAGATREQAAGIPTLADKVAATQPCGYACRSGSCQAPTAEAEVLARAVRLGWYR
jgi:uncharacterized protein